MGRILFMPLDLAPQVETAIRDYATRRGMNTNDYVARLIRIAEPEPVSPAPRKAPRLQVLSREEAIRRNAPSVLRLRAELSEAENATPEEIAVADAEWQSLKQSLNDNRRATGERLLFAETPAP